MPQRLPSRSHRAKPLFALLLYVALPTRPSKRVIIRKTDELTNLIFCSNAWCCHSTDILDYSSTGTKVSWFPVGFIPTICHQTINDGHKDLYLTGSLLKLVVNSRFLWPRGMILNDCFVTFHIYAAYHDRHVRRNSTETQPTTETGNKVCSLLKTGFFERSKWWMVHAIEQRTHTATTAQNFASLLFFFYFNSRCFHNLVLNRKSH